MDLIKNMKEAIAKSGTSKKEIIYWQKESVKRIRFLQELDEGIMIQFHNNWDPQIFVPCHDPEDHEDCKYCKEGIALQDNYIWSVWDYDSNSVRLIQFKAYGISIIPSLIEMYETFGTIKDRDYKIKKVGQGQGGSYVVTPLDKERFKNSKAKPFTEKQVREILDKAWPDKDVEAEEDEDEDEDDTSSKKSKKKAKKKVNLRDKFEELTFKQLKEIALEIGITKKELKAFDDEEELIDELFDNYEEEDLKELLEDIENEDEDEDEDD